nr:MAG TPA: hypothetical protein [Caudoviricetes sp.]
MVYTRKCTQFRRSQADLSVLHCARCDIQHDFRLLPMPDIYANIRHRCLHNQNRRLTFAVKI